MRFLVEIATHNPRDSPGKAEILLDLGEKFGVSMVPVLVSRVMSVYVDNVEAAFSGPRDDHAEVPICMSFRGFGDEDVFSDQGS